MIYKTATKTWELDDRDLQDVVNLLDKIKDLPVAGPREPAIEVMGYLETSGIRLQELASGIKVNEHTKFLKVEIKELVDTLLTTMQNLIKEYGYQCRTRSFDDDKLAQVKKIAEKVESKFRELGSMILEPAPDEAKKFDMFDSLKKSSNGSSEQPVSSKKKLTDDPVQSSQKDSTKKTNGMGAAVSPRGSRSHT